MATTFTQQSTDFIQQIEAEIERLQQLRDQVQAAIQTDEQLDIAGAAPRKRAYKKRAASKKAPIKRRGRSRAEAPGA